MQAFKKIVIAFIISAYPTLQGELIRGKVISIDSESTRVELSLTGKQGNESFRISEGDIAWLEEGDTIRATAAKFGDGRRLDTIWPADKDTEDALNKSASTLRQDTLARGFGAFRKKGERIPYFALLDQHGDIVTTHDLRGEYLVINFIFTRCAAPTMCPASTIRMVDLQDKLNTDGVEGWRLVTLTFDPDYDSPGVLQQYIQTKAILDEKHTFLTGPKGAIDDLMQQFGIHRRNRDGTIDHTMATLIVDPEGRIHYRKDGSRWSVDDFAARIEKALKE